jgi:hypothetical protein
VDELEAMFENWAAFFNYTFTPFTVRQQAYPSVPLLL